MIGLSFTVENISTVMQAYDQIQVVRYNLTSESAPDTPIGDPAALTDWTAISGTDDYPIPITLVSNQTYYVSYDSLGSETDWYSSRYYDSSSGSASAWSEPVLGSEGDLYYDPIYPDEMEFTTQERGIIDRIRIYIGDPLRLERDYGQKAFAAIHPDKKTYELEEKGWPVFINMGGRNFNSLYDPTVNGYRFLKFQDPVDDLCESCIEAENLCGDTVTKEFTYGVDIWYYSFRNSDRQILEAYDSCPIPPGLTSTTVTVQAYILQTSIDILRKELFEDATEDGAEIDDEGTSYDPTPGLRTRRNLLDDLKEQLDELIRSLTLSGITGVLID